MVAVPVRDDHGVESANDLLGGKRERNGWVGDLVARALDRRPRADVVEHRIDQDPTSAELDDHRCAADESDAHAGF